METGNKNTGTNIVSIADAKKAKAEKENEFAPLEAVEPGATRIQGDDWLITACDGEQTYIYLASKAKGRKNFKVTELYPGLTKKRTAVREADKPIDLLLVGKHQHISDVIEDISETLFADLEWEDDGEALN